MHSLPNYQCVNPGYINQATGVCNPAYSCACTKPG